MERLTVRVKEGNRKDECFIPGNKNAIEKVEYICEGERWESEEYKGKAVDKLAEYEDLEEQNRMIKLPCAVGDTVWFIKSNFSYMKNPKAEKVRKIEIIDGEIIFRTENRCFEMKRIGKTVFLTREAAEAALKELCNTQLGADDGWPEEVPLIGVEMLD